MTTSEKPAAEFPQAKVAAPESSDDQHYRNGCVDAEKIAKLEKHPRQSKHWPKR